MSHSLKSLPVDPSASAVERLRYGQTLESLGQFSEAVSAYDESIACAEPVDAFESVEARRTRALAWMNRGNALQKISGPENLFAAVVAYDEAITLFQTLPFATTPVFRNHLGAAWLNRGHALIAASDPNRAVASFEQAIAHLAELPLEDNQNYRLNLAGAWTNLAHILPLHRDEGKIACCARARAAASTALALLSAHEMVTPAFGEMSLRARRAQLIALGELLVAAERARESTDELAALTSDRIDTALTLARRWERRGFVSSRALAARLFRLGAQFYRLHQPHFLAEFILENIDPSQAEAAFAGEEEFLTAANEALALALADLSSPRLLLAGETRTEQLLATVRSLREAQQRLALQRTEVSI